MKRLWIALGLATALALALAACGEEEEGTPSPAAGAGTTPTATPAGRTPTPTPSGATPTAPPAATPGAASVTVRALDFAFNPNRINAQANQPLTVTVRNEGQAPHTFTISELNVDVTVQPGQSMTVTLTPRAASYTFICRFHRGAGMEGTLTTGGGAASGGGSVTPAAGGSADYGY
jgi:plastocyanin